MRRASTSASWAAVRPSPAAAIGVDEVGEHAAAPGAGMDGVREEAQLARPEDARGALRRQGEIAIEVEGRQLGEAAQEVDVQGVTGGVLKKARAVDRRGRLAATHAGQVLDRPLLPLESREVRGCRQPFEKAQLVVVAAVGRAAVRRGLRRSPGDPDLPRRSRTPEIAASAIRAKAAAGAGTNRDQTRREACCTRRVRSLQGDGRSDRLSRTRATGKSPVGRGAGARDESGLRRWRRLFEAGASGRRWRRSRSLARGAGRPCPLRLNGPDVPGACRSNEKVSRREPLRNHMRLLTRARRGPRPARAPEPSKT